MKLKNTKRNLKKNSTSNSGTCHAAKLKRPKQKSSLLSPQLIILFIVIVSLLTGTLCYWLNKHSAVKQQYNKAMLLQNNCEDYSEPLHYLMLIRKDANYTGYGKDVQKQINALKNKYAAQLKNEKEFQRNYNKAMTQCVNKRFYQALETTKLLVNVSQPALRKKGEELQQTIKQELLATKKTAKSRTTPR